MAWILQIIIKIRCILFILTLRSIISPRAVAHMQKPASGAALVFPGLHTWAISATLALHMQYAVAQRAAAAAVVLLGSPLGQLTRSWRGQWVAKAESGCKMTADNGLPRSAPHTEKIKKAAAAKCTIITTNRAEPSEKAAVSVARLASRFHKVIERFQANNKFRSASEKANKAINCQAKQYGYPDPTDYPMENRLFAYQAVWQPLQITCCCRCCCLVPAACHNCHLPVAPHKWPFVLAGI